MKRLASILLLTAVLLSLLAPAAFAAVLTAEEMINCFMAPDFCGKTLAACEGGMSENMRQEVAQMVEAGQSKEEIINYYTGMYGQQILAAPPKSGFYLTAWFMPLIGLVAGAAIVFGYLQRTRQKSERPRNGQETEQADSYYDEELEDEIKKYL